MVGYKGQKCGNLQQDGEKLDILSEVLFQIALLGTGFDLIEPEIRQTAFGLFCAQPLFFGMELPVELLSAQSESFHLYISFG